MKTATLLLLATAIAFAGATVYLGLELGATRDALAAEMQARAAQDARIRQLEAQPIRSVISAQPVPPAPNEPPDSLVPPIPDAVPASRPFNGNRDERPASDFKSVAAQRQYRLMQERRLRQGLADMPGELGLDKAQADRLFDLLADSEVAENNNRRMYANDPIGSRSLADAAREERDASISALLGPDKAAEFLAFEKTLGARLQVGRIDADMTAADIPLREDQRKAMIAAVAAEQAAHPAPERDPTVNDEDYRKRYLEWQVENSQRMQKAVEPLLTSEQRSRYREAVELQNARRAEQRARSEARRNSSRQP